MGFSSVIAMRQTSAMFSGLLLLSTLLAASSSAAAQPSEMTAEDYFAKGYELRAKGDFHGARKEYLNSWTMKKNYATAGNLGAVEQKLGMDRDAAEHLAYSLRYWPSITTDVNSERHRKNIEKLLAEVTKRVGTARIRVVAEDGRSVNSADILVGDTPVGRWPLDVDEVFVDPKPEPQKFVARLPQCDDATWEGNIRAGETLDVSLTLKCPKTGNLRIRAAAEDGRSIDGAEVLVDNKVVGRWPLKPEVFPVEPGPHSFTLRFPECADATWRAEVRAGMNLDVSRTLKCRKAPPWLLSGIGAGVAVAGVGVGIGALVHSSARDNDANETWGRLFALGGKSACYNGANKAVCGDLVDADYDARQFKYISTASFLVAGAGALLAGSAMFAWRVGGIPAPEDSKGRGEKSSAVSITLDLNRDGGGAVVKGRF